jgi:hypothetical protein
MDAEIVSAEKVAFQCPYFLLGFGLGTGILK